MAQHINNVQELLKKHSTLNPKLTVLFSITPDGAVTYDFSAPGTLGDLLLIERIFKLELDKFVYTLKESVVSKNAH